MYYLRLSMKHVKQKLSAVLGSNIAKSHFELRFDVIGYARLGNKAKLLLCPSAGGGGKVRECCGGGGTTYCYELSI